MAKDRAPLFNSSRSSRKADPTGSTVAQDRTQLLNQLTVLFLVLTPLMLACYLLIFLFPQIPFNPLRPIEQPVAAKLGPTPEPTITPTFTRTPHPTNTPTDTPTPSPSASPTVAPSATLAGNRSKATPTPKRTATPAGTPTPTQSPFNYTYELIYQRAQLYGTNWAGIAGLVLGIDLKHQANIDVHAWGDPPLGPDGQTATSGTYVQYGPSGWEFTLADKPAFGKWSVQLVDTDGNPLSPVVEVEMNGDPRTNLAYIIFTQNH